jgi:hypothetical protein
MRINNRIVPGIVKDLLMLATSYSNNAEQDVDCDGVIYYHYWMGFTLKMVSYDRSFYGHGIYINLYEHEINPLITRLNRKIRNYLHWRRATQKYSHTVLNFLKNSPEHLFKHWKALNKIAWDYSYSRTTGR